MVEVAHDANRSRPIRCVRGRYSGQEGVYIAALPLMHRVRLNLHGDVCLSRATFKFTDFPGDDSDAEGAPVVAQVVQPPPLTPAEHRRILRASAPSLPAEVVLLVDLTVMVMGRLGVEAEEVCRLIREREWHTMRC